jgi:hypothetical protein
MSRRDGHVGGVLVAICLLFAPGVARAQKNDSSITGVARDSSGAVLPGVTVEVSSPALIERARSAVSDSSGQYRVVELPPGTYTVTFSIPGFATMKREGIELTSGFTATVNAELRVGQLSETITVSGASPIVDTQNIVQQQVMTRNVIDTVPTDKDFANLAVLIPGMNTSAPDTGGSAGSQRQHIEIHGGRSSDEYILINGMSIGFAGTSGPSPLIYPDGSVEEMKIETIGHSAEMETGGVWVGIVPKAGGNDFKGSVFGSFSNHSLQSNVLTADLKARGLLSADSVDRISDFNPSIGGPLIRDKLWFHVGYRNWNVIRNSVVLYNTNPAAWTYTPDLSRGPVPNQELQNIGTANFTWQASPKNKFSVNTALGRTCECQLFLAGGTTTLEGAARTLYPYKLVQGTWQSPATNHLLFDVGASAFLITHEVTPESTAVGPAAVELTTGENFRSRAIGTAGGYNNPYTNVKWNNFTVQGSASYVTGAHHFKAGGILNPKPEDMTKYTVDGSDYQVNLLNGRPSSIVFGVLPLREITNVFSGGAFAQDQWTISRWTFHAALRFDRVWVNFPAVSESATPRLPSRTYAAVSNIIDRRDFSPRLGLAWDVFGNGKTAVKISVDKYLLSTNEDHTQAVSANPAITTAANATRTWSDANGDFIPQGDPLNPLANGEFGPSNNAVFGSSASTFALDPTFARGWGVRADEWETSASIQQQIMPRVSIMAGYDRRNYGKLSAIINSALSPTDFSPYCVTTPVDSRLPSGGGQTLCGLFDVSPSKVGALSQIQTLASNFGNAYEYWQGVDFSVHARLTSKSLLDGGVDIGGTTADNCDIASKYQNMNQVGGITVGVNVPLSFCHKAQPVLADYKLMASYELPANVQVSAAFQSHPGITSTFSTSFGVAANTVFTNSQIAPSLGRNLSTGANGTVTISIVPPGSVIADRLNQLDFRVARMFSVSQSKVKVMIDLYNMLNATPALTLNGTYGTTGATWQVPTSTLQGRLVKFGAQWDF